MPHAAPAESTGYATFAAWWSAAVHLPAKVRVAMQADPTRFLPLVLTFLAERLRQACVTLPNHGLGYVTGWDVAIDLCYRRLRNLSEGTPLTRAEVAAIVAPLDTALAVAGATVSGGPSWASTARTLSSALHILSDPVNATTHAEAAVTGLGITHTQRFPTQFPWLFPAPTNVSDPS